MTAEMEPISHTNSKAYIGLPGTGKTINILADINKDIKQGKNVIYINTRDSYVSFKKYFNEHKLCRIDTDQLAEESHYDGNCRLTVIEAAKLRNMDFKDRICIETDLIKLVMKLAGNSDNTSLYIDELGCMTVENLEYLLNEFAGPVVFSAQNFKCLSRLKGLNKLIRHWRIFRSNFQEETPIHLNEELRNKIRELKVFPNNSDYIEYCDIVDNKHHFDHLDFTGEVKMLLG